MKLLILLTGKTDEKWVAEGMEVYARRIRNFTSFEIREVSVSKRKTADPERQKAAEAEMLLQAVQPGDYLVLLDEKGRTQTSRQMAANLDAKLNQNKRLVLVVGGAYGFSPEIRNRADDLWSLSPLTFPHQLVRIILLEQVYRAFSILSNSPYHHD